MANKIYRNRMIINQRGGSITIDNTTEQEKVNISQRSGSNITLANYVTSELATNNKQTLVINDEFKTVYGNHSDFVGKKRIIRTCEDTIELKGCLNEEQIAAYQEWKETMGPLALAKSQFAIKRGGYSIPNGVETPKIGEHARNPALDAIIHAVNNDLSNLKIPIGLRTYCNDSVSTYEGIQRFFCAGGNIGIGANAILGASFGGGIGASANLDAGALIDIGICDENGLFHIDAGVGADVNANIEVNLDKGISVSAGVEVVIGSPANTEENHSTEGGFWEINEVVTNIPNLLKEIQEKLVPIELKMGKGGDEVIFTKGNIFTQIGAMFNDFPTLRVDPKGRSQPSSVFVGENGAFNNFTPVPYTEEVDQSSNCPCGNDEAVIGNRLTRTVGAGGIQLKTVGSLDLGGTKLKTGFKTINLNAELGIQIASESIVDIQSANCISLRSNNQVYVESSLGVKGNVLVSGGMYVEGELYCQHLTAPMEVHKTIDTIVTSKFNTLVDKKLKIGDCLIYGNYFPVYALAKKDLIITDPHSHHVVGPAMKLISKNTDLRTTAMLNSINSSTSISQALPRVNEDKTPIENIGNTVGGTGVVV